MNFGGASEAAPKPRTRRHFDDASLYKQGDFLRGEPGAPSSQEHFHDPLEKKAFKPGWQRIRAVPGIHPSTERLELEAAQAQQKQAAATARRDNLLQRQLQKAYNPITGQEYSAAAQGWQAAADPWAHRKPCVRPAPTIARATAASEQVAAGHATLTPEQTQRRISALQEVTCMRRDRMASDGLPPSRRQATGTMREVLQWG